MLKNQLVLNFAFLITLTFLLNACTSPMKLVETGNYDQAIDASIKKLSGKKKKKHKHVMALETAFGKATKRDMYQAEALRREGQPENWEKINNIHKKIKKRQNKVSPLLPLYDEAGNKAVFSFVKIEDLEQESKKKAAEYLYARAQKLLREAENGNKQSARTAYNELDKINKYYRDYRDKISLKEKAKILGTTHVLFKMENNAGVVLPRQFDQELRQMNVRDLNDKWRSFHLSQKNNIDYDYKIVMNITDINVSPERVQERQYIDDKEIEEGFEYVLDENGNVMKDTSGNDIKIPKKILIKARVFETFQNKIAGVGGVLRYYDNHSGEILKSEPLAVDAIFENYASTFEGDKRALSKETQNRIGNRPRPFPTNESLLLQAADLMKPVIKEKIGKSRVIL